MPNDNRFDDLDLREEPVRSDSENGAPAIIGYSTDNCTIGCSIHGC